MDRAIYQDKLEELAELFESTPNTPMAMFHKVVSLITLNMRYEKISFTLELNEHPYVLTKALIEDEIVAFRARMDAQFIESASTTLKDGKSLEMEVKHQELFNIIWKEYSGDVMQDYVDRYLLRVRINDLPTFAQNGACIDLGCGNGVFCFALAQSGLSRCEGVDYGSESIAYANTLKETIAGGDKCEFVDASVYELPYPDDSFDLALQNGVFHHLDHPDRAIEEARRVLKPGGYFWYYTEGSGGIHRDLFGRSVELLRDVPSSYTHSIMKLMNVESNKFAHLMDGLNATYIGITWEEATEMLARHGFGDFQRMLGGTDTDFDHDRIEADPYGVEKFGEGDLRILARLL